MRIPCWRGRAVALVLGVVGPALAACSEPTPPPLDVVPVAYDTEHFRILDEASLDSATIVRIAERLELEYGRVGAVLDTITPPDRITAQILAGIGLPTVTAAQNTLTLWSDSLALEYVAHQLTHLYTGYARREFVEEGLAVYVSELVLAGDSAVHPYRRQPSHAWVSLFQEHGSLIPLATAYGASNLGYSLQGSTFDASSWQIFLEGGSWVRWVVETYGWPAWWETYLTDDPTTALDATPAELETNWLAATVAQYPDPRECEDALGTVGPREAFWCRRARGEASLTAHVRQPAVKVTKPRSLQDAPPSARMPE